MKVADYIIRKLADYGVSEMFVVYGAANGDLIDAFTRVSNTRYIAVQHEQAGGFAAEGWAKIKAKPGVAIATSGPGGMNLLTPMGNCYYDSVPCLFITGQINSRFLRNDSSIRQVGFQENDIVAMATPVTKYAQMLMHPEDVRYELEKALYLSTSGRPGPVLLDVPLDIQKKEIAPEKLVGFLPVGLGEKDYNLNEVSKQIDHYFHALRNCQRPVILVGGGVRISGAVEQLRKMTDLLRIPVFPTWNALDIVTSDYKYYGGRIGTYGGPGRNFGLQNSDLLLAIGSRISGRITGGNLQSFARGAKKYTVDVDLALLQPKLQQVPFDVNIHCDAKLFLEILADRLNRVQRERLPEFDEWNQQVWLWKDKYDPVKPEYFTEKRIVHPYAFMRILSEEMSEDDILVGDCGGNIVTSNHSFKTKWGQRNITNNGNSPMGFSFAGAMGAWFAAPNRQVVCTIGDGGFQMNIQELQTYKHYGVKVKTFILNNQCYGITRQYQKTNFQGRVEACGPKGYSVPDFVSICQAYGIRTVVIKDIDNARRAIREVLNADEPVV